VRFALGVLAGMLLIVSLAGSGQGDERKARALFREGNRLYKEGDYQGALQLFRDAYAEEPNPKILLNIAGTQFKLGRLDEAANAYQLYVDDPAAAQDKIAQANKVLAAIDPQVAVLKLTLPDVGLGVEVDGIAVAGAGVTRQWRVMAGHHEVRAARGAQTFEVTVEVVRGERKPVVVILQAPAPVAPPEPAPVRPGPTPDPALPVPQPTPAEPKPVEPTPASIVAAPSIPDRGQARPRSRRKLFGIVTVASGGAAMLAGGYFGMRARSLRDNALAPGSGCDQNFHCVTGTSGLADARAANDAATASTVLFVAGTALATGGLVLWLTAPDEQRAVQLTPTAGPDGLGVSLRATF
jgi:hypothetical protein